MPPNRSLEVRQKLGTQNPHPPIRATGPRYNAVERVRAYRAYCLLPLWGGFNYIWLLLISFLFKAFLKATVVLNKVVLKKGLFLEIFP